MGAAQPKMGTLSSGLGFLQMEARLNFVPAHTRGGQVGDSFQHVTKQVDGISSLKEMAQQLNHFG